MAHYCCQQTIYIDLVLGPVQESSTCGIICVYMVVWPNDKNIPGFLVGKLNLAVADTSSACYNKLHFKLGQGRN